MLREDCPYFEIKTVSVLIPSGSLDIRIPLCQASQVMAARLNTTEAGRQVTVHLTTPHQGESRILYGPDFDLLTLTVCHRKRLQKRCQPAFARLLTDLQLDPTLPPTE